MAANPNDDLDNFVLPSAVAHHSWVGRSQDTDEYGLRQGTPANRWMDWMLKLKFMKGGVEKNGTAFFVNIPSIKYNVILTAGHNLVDTANTYTTNLRIILAKGSVDITPDMIRVCQKYLENPSENFAIYDYGAILLPRNKIPIQHGFGFGFGLMLSIAPSLDASNANGTSCDPDQDPLQNHMVYVSGYRPGDSPDKQKADETEPRRSDGNCLWATSSQLVYRADTEAGMSGGAVWLGYRGVETVVAIHNYGGGSDKDRKNKGSRINLDVWRTVCTWADAIWTDKSLHYYSTDPKYKAAAGSPTYQMHLHIQMPSPMPEIEKTYIDDIGSGRVRVGCPGKVETFFDVLPVFAQPTDAASHVCFGFLLAKYAVPAKDEEDGDNGTGAKPAKAPVVLRKKSLWVHWNPASSQVSVAEYLDTHAEVRLPTLVMKPQMAFAMQVRVDNGFMHVKMEREDLMEADLEPLAEDHDAFEDTTEVSFIKLAKDRCFRLEKHQ